MAWRLDGEGRPGYELLIGTDPGKAPRGLNRWGFVSEQGTANGGEVLALMTGAAVGSFAEAKADTAGGNGSARLKVLQGRLASGTAEGRVSQLAFASPPTIHDVDGVLARLRVRGRGHAARVGADPRRCQARAADGARRPGGPPGAGGARGPRRARRGVRSRRCPTCSGAMPTNFGCGARA